MRIFVIYSNKILICHGTRKLCTIRLGNQTIVKTKSNFVILEDSSTLLGERIKIDRMLESEGNQQHAEDKFNRVDMLAENSKGELVIIEVQNNRSWTIFIVCCMEYQRLLPNTSQKENPTRK